jgi:regulator of cell morphogenesis and NO signaling
MNELSNQTLAQIVTSNHRTAAVFEKYQLDFCCKGKRSLLQACNEKNLSVDVILNELTSVSSQSAGSCQFLFPYDKLSLSQLGDYIVNTHHAYIKKEIPQIYAYMQKLASKHGQRHLELFKIFELVGAIKEEMELHMEKEEKILFPRIKEMENISRSPNSEYKLSISFLQSPITVMEQEHDHAGQLMEEIRNLSNNYQVPPDGCTTHQLCYASLKAFEMDLHHHVHLENNLLFPKAIELAKSISETTLN